MPLESALRLTFKPDNLCDVCKMVKAAKQQQEQSPAATAKEFGKILLVFAPAPTVVVASASKMSWPPCARTMCSVDRGAPPIPPPRGLAA
jgi:hypothetical protein